MFSSNISDLLQLEELINCDPIIGKRLFAQYKRVRQEEVQALALALGRLGYYNCQTEIKSIEANSHIYYITIKKKEERKLYD